MTKRRWKQQMKLTVGIPVIFFHPLAAWGFSGQSRFYLPMQRKPIV
jgi:hypothetical protein